MIFNSHINQAPSSTMTKKQILSELAQTRNIIKNKYKQAYSDRIERERKMQETFKPVITELKPITDIFKKSSKEGKNTIKKEEKKCDVADLCYNKDFANNSTSAPVYSPTTTTSTAPVFSTPISKTARIINDEETSPVKSSSSKTKKKSPNRRRRGHQIFDSYMDTQKKWLNKKHQEQRISKADQQHIEQMPKLPSSPDSKDEPEEISPATMRKYGLMEFPRPLSTKRRNGVPTDSQFLLTKAPDLMPNSKILPAKRGNGNKRILPTKRRLINDSQSLLSKRKRNSTDNFHVLPSKRKRYDISYDNASGDGIQSPLDFNFIPYISNPRIVYQHFDDPNEICERLRLLISSRLAGNSNHMHEISSIIEELREIGCIF